VLYFSWCYWRIRFWRGLIYAQRFNLWQLFLPLLIYAPHHLVIDGLVIKGATAISVTLAG
jgi:hypothetical protein